MFCLLYSPKQKVVKFHAQKQIGKSHVIDIFTIEDMENISLRIFQYFTLYYIIKLYYSNHNYFSSKVITTTDCQSIVISWNWVLSKSMKVKLHKEATQMSSKETLLITFNN
jgi:hypothetical protein